MPMTTFNFNESPRVVHVRLGSVRWFLELIVRFSAHMPIWGRGKRNITDRQRVSYDAAKEYVKV